MINPTIEEKQIVIFLARGMTHSEIAIETSYSPRTVGNKVFKILKKYSARNATHLLSIFISNGWITLPKTDSPNHV